ncbi:hypothetical protein LCGC14_0363380 [marine sediment metagenome]|uniref:Uncharacterized protein n=1 Tax=marine sediment metagenome TaxID=412755 RepID=A0A0F9VUI8_9ZZZZ
MKLIRPAKLDSEGNNIPPLVQLNKDIPHSPLAFGVLMVMLFIVGMAIISGIFIFYDKFFKQPEYVPDYHTLRDNLVMPDGRSYWDDNNHTDMMVAAQILETYLDKKIAGENETNITVEQFLKLSAKPILNGGGGSGGRRRQ